jgi:hypothetical protein
MLSAIFQRFLGGSHQCLRTDSRLSLRPRPAAITIHLFATSPLRLSPTTSRILTQRMKTADERRLIPGEKARQRIQQWPSRSSRMPNKID